MTTLSPKLNREILVSSFYQRAVVFPLTCASIPTTANNNYNCSGATLKLQHELTDHESMTNLQSVTSSTLHLKVMLQ